MSDQKTAAILQNSKQCPSCHSEDIAVDDASYPFPEVKVKMNCVGCGHTWTEVYTFVKVE